MHVFNKLMIVNGYRNRSKLKDFKGCVAALPELDQGLTVLYLSNQQVSGAFWSYPT